MDIGAVQMPVANLLDRVAESAFGATAKTTGAATEAPEKGDFAGMVQKSLAAVDATQTQSESLAHQYQLGQNGVTLEDAMISMQKANISFQTTVQVRNRLVAAYNDVMNMQI